ncbi:MAG TPA: hypothetical protein VGE52_04645 [Pirellulales bacterium]
MSAAQFLQFAPLLAVDLGSIATVIVTIVGLVIYAVNQVLEVQKMNPPAGPQRPGQRQADPFANPNAPRPQRPAQRGDEVDNYLRDVTARPQQPPRRPPAFRPEPQRQKPAPQSSGERLAPVGSLSQQHAIEDRAKQFSQRVSSDVAGPDGQLPNERHLQSSLKNQVGSIGTLGDASEAAMNSGSNTIDTSTTFAADLRAMLANPKTLQQAVMLQEILTPPSHRW